MKSSVSATEYQLFDNLGRMTQMSQITDGHAYTSKYTYNLSGALVEEEYPSGRKVKNEFESDGDLLKVTSQKNSSSVYTPYASNFSYTASGGISQMKLGNGRWETAKFNTRLQVTELGLGTAATNAGLWKTAYEYGELQSNGTVDTTKNTGNIARQTLTVPGTSFVQSYEYDSLYRLKVATEKTGSTQNWTQSWSYDRYGNRIGFAQDIAGFTNSPNPAIDANTNRFSSGQGFTYDLNGNLVVDNEGRQFTFNGDNKQTIVRDAANNVIGQYFFDGEGKRVKKITNSETTVFVYSSGKLVAEYSNQISQAPTVAYTTTDHLGSPRIITDQYGQVKSRRDFMPFCEDIYIDVGGRTSSLQYSSSADDIKQKFTGYLKDTETGLDFAEARMYQNRHGRFTAPDPLLASGSGLNPQTFNRYIYTGNNPVNYSDPSGLIWCGQSGGRKGIQWQEGNECSGSGWKPLDLDSSYPCSDGPCTIRGTTYAPGTVFRFGADGTHRAALADPGSRPAESQQQAVAGATQNTPGQGASEAAAGAAAPGAGSGGATENGVIPLPTAPGSSDVISLCTDDFPCKPGASTASFERLDVANASAPKTVKAIEFLASACGTFFAPCGIVAAIFKAGRGDLGGAGDELIGSIPGIGFLRKADKVADAAEAAHTVYRGINPATRVVEYVGITKRAPNVRWDEHAFDPEKAHLVFEVVKGATGLTKMQARIWEQKLILKHGMTKFGGTLLNKRNEIAKKYWGQHGIEP